MDAKGAALASVKRNEADLISLSHLIHSHPEVRWEEERACAWTAEALDTRGFEVESGYCGMPTAFAARAGSGPLHIAICAEYDALPEIGHACGHNIIAAAAVGAGLALAPLVDDVGLTVTVLGTPAEEGGGGKVLMLERGAFDDVHAALMVHPGPVECLEPAVRAVAHFDVFYTGRESHAAAAPERGVNAADALVVAQSAIGLLRQHLGASDQVHGFVMHGGDAANVVPAHTSGRWMVRSETMHGVEAVRARVERCFEAGALATGAALSIEDVSPAYTHMDHDAGLAAIYRTNAEDLGRSFPAGSSMTFSTDMGNVSLAVPSIHPLHRDRDGGAMNHQSEFAAACVGASADSAVVDGAVAMAWTAIDAATGPQRDRLLRRAG
ncbi:MAG: amidohydrolase [Acidimicrobiia bacterium]|nr:amidohydrolase [Acidimicrobiia bacterium]